MDMAARLKAVRQRISLAANQAGRNPQSVTLIAVSKTQSDCDIAQAWRLGQRHFGESYVQEAMHKQQKLAHFPMSWHFIGPLQSNKTRHVANAFSWVHSVDRYKIAKRLSEHRSEQLPALNICLQVNISQEPTKSGVLPAQLPELAESVSRLPHLNLRGLMAIPARTDDLAQQRRLFRELRSLYDQLNQFNLDTLSMGMSNDLEAAVAEGATLVRVGTDLFGTRKVELDGLRE
ncbi:MAG: YggS family pyridoxal phosphate-dependent enzyme [Methylococcales bacterium]